MHWHFRGTIASKRTLPEPVSFRLVIGDWSKQNVSALVAKAPISLTITTREAALDQLKNSGQEIQLAHLLQSLLGISFVQYWHDAGDGEGHFLGVTLGLTSKDIASLTPDLNLALWANLPVKIGATGGFSISENNRHSHQPTMDGFEINRPLLLSDISFELLPPG